MKTIYLLRELEDQFYSDHYDDALKAFTTIDAAKAAAEEVARAKFDENLADYKAGKAISDAVDLTAYGISSKTYKPLTWMMVDSEHHGQSPVFSLPSSSLYWVVSALELVE